MRRIKGIVRSVVAIAGAISLNSPMVIAGSGQGFLNGLPDVACKTGRPMTSVDQPVTMKGRIGQFKREGSDIDLRQG